MAMESARHRITLLALAAVLYGTITSVFIRFEHPGLGIGHLFYVPIVLVAFATGPALGGAAGALAALLYNAGILVNPRLPSTLEVEQTLIRLLTFVAIGVLIGIFVRRNRNLVAELSRLADRDSVTGLPNTRVFQSAIERRLDAGAGFVLLVGDIDELRRLNRESREEGDDALRRLAEPFHRLEGDRRTPGTGLGLSIVRSVADAHGAELALRSRPEGGLVAEVRFP